MTESYDGRQLVPKPRVWDKLSQATFHAPTGAAHAGEQFSQFFALFTPEQAVQVIEGIEETRR